MAHLIEANTENYTTSRDVTGIDSVDFARSTTPVGVSEGPRSMRSNLQTPGGTGQIVSRSAS